MARYGLVGHHIAAVCRHGPSHVACQLPCIEVLATMFGCGVVISVPAFRGLHDDADIIWMGT